MTTTKQTLNFFEEESHSKYRKAARAELRALRDAFPLKTEESIGEPYNLRLKQEVVLRTVNAFCTAEEINLKYLSKFLKEHKMFTKTVGYYGECIYAQVSLLQDRNDVLRSEYSRPQHNNHQYSEQQRSSDNSEGLEFNHGSSGESQGGTDSFKEHPFTNNEQHSFTNTDQHSFTNNEHPEISIHSSKTQPEINHSTFDVFFFEFGVTVFWGASPQMENKILRLIKVAEVNSYRSSQIELENFSYGITNDALFCNDIIYLNSDYFFHKMVISCAIAQSVKLDYFEEITDDAIDEIKHLPEEVGNVGRTNYTRTDILKFIGRLHKLKINLNLVTNILDEPELLWNFPKYSGLYESFKHCLEIKTRADILNQRCDVIHGILEILSENINTRNSEKLEKMIIGLIAVSVVVGIVQIIVLLYKR